MYSLHYGLLSLVHSEGVWLLRPLTPGAHSVYSYKTRVASGVANHDGLSIFTIFYQGWIMKHFSHILVAALVVVSMALAGYSESRANCFGGVIINNNNAAGTVNLVLLTNCGPFFVGLVGPGTIIPAFNVTGCCLTGAFDLITGTFTPVFGVTAMPAPFTQMALDACGVQID